MTESDERRGAKRVERTHRLLHREYMLTADKPDYIDDGLVDLSCDGFAFLTGHHYGDGDLIEVRLLLFGWETCKTEFYYGDPRKASDPLVALAKVVNVRAQPNRTWKIGAAFESIDEWHRKALARYLEKEAAGNL